MEPSVTLEQPCLKLRRFGRICWTAWHLMKLKLLLPSPPSRDCIARVVRKVFDAELDECRPAGTGLLGHVYAV